MSEALLEGLRITVLGMGLVFLLLGLLQALLVLLLRTDRPEAPAAEEPDREEVCDEAGLDPAVLAAVMVAVRQHRIVRRRQAAPAMRAHLPGTLQSRWVVAGRTRQNRSWAPGGRFI